jgi:hypothetical protein
VIEQGHLIYHTLSRSSCVLIVYRSCRKPDLVTGNVSISIGLEMAAAHVYTLSIQDASTLAALTMPEDKRMFASFRQLATRRPAQAPPRWVPWRTPRPIGGVVEMAQVVRVGYSP